MKYFIFLSAFIVSKLTIPMLKKFLFKSKCLMKNYRGNLIIYGMGIIYVFNILLMTMLFFTYFKYIDKNFVLIYLIGVLTMGLVGIIDDFLGSSNVKGFKGHIKKLINGDLTTGGIKAVFGGLISVFISFLISKNIFDFVINFILISLFTNFINLLDLRPGRALKIHLLISVIFLILLNGIYDYFLLITMAITIAYLPYDLREISMIGDTGANIIGVTLGIIGTALQLSFKIGLVLFLISVHVYCEKYSLSDLILKNKILRYIDSIGR
ncbi:glycosyltransferase [Caminicella sporogenes]|uniref:glycosyltransferase n=1 Tax=Caminicella sporogenes TaxID=166485 RepID=UPI002540BD3C|nr:glycosyltransferase [Caminicella sporogenes]WIF94555.1 glycosyltransferase [Caminicella sporogenes]